MSTRKVKVKSRQVIDYENRTEGGHQIVVVNWCDEHKISIYHIPNGGWRRKETARGLMYQGVRPGIPDLHIPVARGGWHSLYIEMKKIGGNRPSKEQVYWLNKLRELGHLCVCCYGSNEAIDVIEKYVSSESISLFRSNDGVLYCHKVKDRNDCQLKEE